MTTTYFKRFSTDELIVMVKSLTKDEVIPQDSELRTAAKQIAGNDNLLSMLSLGIFLADELADRMEIFLFNEEINSY